jgi:hypothetical protein
MEAGSDTIRVWRCTHIDEKQAMSGCLRVFPSVSDWTVLMETESTGRR